MKNRIILSVLIAFIVCNNIQAKKLHFYNSKTDLVGVSGDIEYLVNCGYNEIIRKNPVEINLPLNQYFYNKQFKEKELEKALNDMQIGKKILDYLFNYKDGKLSEDMLKERAWDNVQRRDIERASAGAIDAETALKDDYLPILQNNYIFLKYRYASSKSCWIVFHVDIDKETMEAVFNAWDDPAKYETIRVNVSYVAQNKFKTSKPTKMSRGLSKKVPAFAIRGQVISRAPFMAEVGSKLGVKNRNRMVVYRQKMNKNGDMVSEKVCTTRASNVSKDSTYLYTIAGGNASYKKGDIAIRKRDSYIGNSFYANMMNNSYGINYMFDYMMSFNRHGMSSHFLVGVGASVLKDHPKNLYYVENNVYKSPYILDGSLGLGLGFTMLHSVQVMPYVTGQYEYFMLEQKKKNTSSNEETSSINASSVNVPVGVRISINAMYPLQLIIGAEYKIVVFKPKGSSEGSTISYQTLEERVLNPIDAKRSGLNLYAGFRICL